MTFFVDLLRGSVSLVWILAGRIVSFALSAERKCEIAKGLDTPKTVVLFLSVNSKSSKESMTDCVVSSRWAMLFFEILPFTDKK